MSFRAGKASSKPKPSPQVVAAAVGVAAIGGLMGLAHARQNAIRIVDARLFPAGLRYFRYPGVRVRLDGPIFSRSEGGGGFIAYRLRNGGRTLPVYRGYDRDLLIPLGYAAPIERPRLDVYKDRQLVRTLDLPPLPLPARTSLGSKPHPFLRLIALGDDPFSSSLDPRMDPNGTRPTLEAVPRRPIPKGESWDIHIVRTPFYRIPEEDTLYAPNGNLLYSIFDSGVSSSDSSGTNAIRLALPYAATAGEAEVVVRRSRDVDRHEDVRIPDLQLVKGSDGQTLLTIASDRVITTSDGTRFRLFRQNTRRPKAVPHPDEMSVALPAIIETQSTDIRLVSPRLKELGIRRFVIPNSRDQIASRKYRIAPNVVRPMRTTPFTAVLRIKKTESVTFQTIRACVPMEKPTSVSSAPPK